MNGIKFIREKSNISRKALAERMGVTRQSVTLWEKGVRKPDKRHLKCLCDFYGIEEKWFGELSENELENLKEMRMYRHYDGDKEYFSFVPDENDSKGYLSVKCGSLTEMLDERYADTLKKKKEFMLRIERYLQIESKRKVCLFDKICVPLRRMRDIDDFFALMETMQGIGAEGLYLKVPFMFEIRTALYAMMVVSGQYTIEEIKSKYSIDFEEGGIHIDTGYMEDLIEIMSKHWIDNKNREIEKERRIKEYYKKKKQQKLE